MNDSNVESLLKAILYGDPKYVVKPQSRVEALLLAIYESGGGGGGGDDTYTRAQIDAKIASCVPKVRKIATATLDKDISAAELASMLELSTTYVDQKNVTSNKTDVTSSGSKIPNAKAVYGFVDDATSKAVKFSACVYGANYNDFAETGFYEALGNSTDQTQNAPDGKNNDNNYYVITNKRDDQYARQTAYSARVAGIIYTRVKTDNVWRAWERIATDTVLNDYATKTEISLVENAIKGTADGQFVTDENAVMTKTVPEKCKKGVVAKISGKTIVITQITSGIESYTPTAQYQGRGVNVASYITPNDKHKYYMTMKIKGGVQIMAGFGYWGGQPNKLIAMNVKPPSNSFQQFDGIIVNDINPNNKQVFVLECGTSGFTKIETSEVMFIDLTKSFGAGNEPNLDTARRIFSEYIPMGSYLYSAPVVSVVSQGANMINVNELIATSSYNTAGLTYEISGGAIKLTGTKTSSSWADFYFTLSGDKPTFKKGVKYYFKKSTTNSNVKVTLQNKAVQTIAVIDVNQNSVSFTPSEDVVLNAALITVTSNAAVNTTFKLMVSNVDTEIKDFNKTTLSVPKEVLDLPDYGCSADDIKNEIDFENGVYYHRVGSVDLGSLIWIYISEYAAFLCDGFASAKNCKMPASGAVTPNIITGKYKTASNSSSANGDISLGGSGKLFIKDSTFGSDVNAFKQSLTNQFMNFELADNKKEVINISDIIFPFQCETGGTVTLVNEHNIDMSNAIIYEKEVL